MPQLSTLPTQKPVELLKLATNCKKAGDIKNAVRILKEAHKAISRTATDHGVDVFLRLPRYQQLAKRPEQAWKEFNLLLVEGYPNQNRDEAFIVMDHSIIYDKMRLFLQRENCSKEAVKFGIFSWLLWAISLQKQEKKKELRSWTTGKKIDALLLELLDKANRLELQYKLKQFLEQELTGLPNLNFPVLGKYINDLVLS